MRPIERRNTPIPVGERRKSDRFMVSLPAFVQEGPAFPVTVSVCDVSATGIRFEGSATLNLRRRYPVELLLPNGERVRAQAKIVWVRSEPFMQTYGAQWTDLSWWERRKLLRALGNEAVSKDETINWWNVAAMVCFGTGLLALAALFYLRGLLPG